MNQKFYCPKTELLPHDGRDRDSRRRRQGERQDDQAENEEGGLFPRLFGRLRDAERIDEHVGEKVEQLHPSIMRVRCIAGASP